MSQPSQVRSIQLQPIQSSDGDVVSLARQLIHLSKPFGLDLSEQLACTLVMHLLYVEQVNSYINLTRINDRESGLTLHILDSLLLARFIPSDAKSLLDMGSGPGYPGIPLSQYLSLSTTLVDSVNKKILFDRAVIVQMELHEVTALHARLEELPHLVNRFDCVVCRALASLPILIEYASPLVSMGGSLVVAKGAPDESEVSKGEAAAELCGFTFDSTSSFELPNGLGHRTVIVFKKVRSARIHLPRAIGMARKQPLV